MHIIARGGGDSWRFPLSPSVGKGGIELNIRAIIIVVFAATLMSVALAATHTPTAEGEPDTFDGTATYDWFMEDQNAETFHLDSAEDLMGFVAIVNNDYKIEGDSTFSGKTVALDADIDLQSMTWNPIGPGVTMGSSFGADYYFAGTFDGNGHTISNMTFKTVDNLWTYGISVCLWTSS